MIVLSTIVTGVELAIVTPQKSLLPPSTTLRTSSNPAVMTIWSRWLSKTRQTPPDWKQAKPPTMRESSTRIDAVSPSLSWGSVPTPGGGVHVAQRCRCIVGDLDRDSAGRADLDADQCQRAEREHVQHRVVTGAGDARRVAAGAVDRDLAVDSDLAARDLVLAAREHDRVRFGRGRGRVDRLAQRAVAGRARAGHGVVGARDFERFGACAECSERQCEREQRTIRWMHGHDGLLLPCSTQERWRRGHARPVSLVGAGLRGLFRMGRRGRRTPADDTQQGYSRSDLDGTGIAAADVIHADGFEALDCSPWW